MKRIITALIALLTLVACGNKQSEPDVYALNLSAAQIKNALGKWVEEYRIDPKGISPTGDRHLYNRPRTALIIVDSRDWPNIRSAELICEIYKDYPYTAVEALDNIDTFLKTVIPEKDLFPWLDKSIMEITLDSQKKPTIVIDNRKVVLFSFQGSLGIRLTHVDYLDEPKQKKPGG